MIYRFIILTILGLSLASCASTSLVDSWKTEAETENFESEQYSGDQDKSESKIHRFQKPMIIGISDSQQTRQLYEKQFIAGLKQKNITAIPSYTLINSKQKINRETVIAAIKGTDIDSVLVTYRIADNAEFVHDQSIVNPGHEGHDETNNMSSTIVTKRGYSRSNEVFMLKTDMYAVESRSLVWSAQTESVGPSSVDQVIIEVTDILIDRLFSDGMLVEQSLTDELLQYINVK